MHADEMMSFEIRLRLFRWVNDILMSSRPTMDQSNLRRIVPLFANDFHRMSVEAPNFVDALESYRHPTSLFY